MSNTNCDLIKDLLPLYADDIVSESSRHLIDEHLKTCPSCANYYQMIKADNNIFQSNNAANDKAVIKKMRNAITRKRVITACIACLSVLVIAAAVFYFGFVRENYISYEDTELTYIRGRIQTQLTGYHIYICEPDDSGVAFIYAAATPYDLYLGQKHVDTLPLLEEEHWEDINFFEYGEDIPSSHFHIKEVYYVPKEYISKVRHADEWSEGTLEELKSVSQLIWEAE